ncbi:MAG: flagellar biosynthetic protein FliR [Alphaproteobacteria bacterium]
MILPGFGEAYVTPRIRLLFALAFGILLTPLLQARMPLVPQSPYELFLMLGGEMLVGAFIGLLARIILMSLHVAGTIIAQQSSLAVASMFDPSNGGQSAVGEQPAQPARGDAVLRARAALPRPRGAGAELRHLPAGQFPSVSDMNLLQVRVAADAFNLGVLLAAPHMVFSLLFYLAGA